MFEIGRELIWRGGGRDRAEAFFQSNVSSINNPPTTRSNPSVSPRHARSTRQHLQVRSPAHRQLHDPTRSLTLLLSWFAIDTILGHHLHDHLSLGKRLGKTSGKHHQRIPNTCHHHPIGLRNESRRTQPSPWGMGMEVLHQERTQRKIV